jgi:hypothetical protein
MFSHLLYRHALSRTNRVPSQDGNYCHAGYAIAPLSDVLHADVELGIIV